MPVMELIAGLSLGLFILLGASLRHLVRQRQDGSLKSKVIAATGCSVVVTDATIPRHPIAYANPAFRLLTGYADEEVLGQSLSFLNGPHTDRGAIEKLAMAVQDGRACRILMRHYRKNGTPFWNEVTLSPVKNRAGHVTEYIWVMSDVTQRQQAESALKDGHDPARILSELLSDGIIVTGDAGILYANPSGLRLLGAERPEQVVGRPLQSFLSPGSCSLMGRQLDLHLPVAPTPPTAGQLLRVDGRPVDVRLASSPLLWQGKPAWVVAVSNNAGEPTLDSPCTTVEETSERRQAEAALRESQERLDLAVRAAHVGIFEHHHRTDHLYWSPTLRELYGIGADEPVSLQRYIELVPREERDTVVSMIQAAHDPAGDGLFQMEHRIVKPNGDIRHIAVRAQTLFDREGSAPTPLRTLGTVMDVTDRKRAEVYQRDASKMEAIGTLAGGIAHEFNNSLTAVLGFSELALPLIPSDSKAHRHIQQVVAAGRKSRELVHQLLTFSQQSGPIRRPLSLHSLVKESLKLLRPTIPSWIELHEHIAASTRPISADTTQMHQLILNLVDNALHAMRQSGGTLDIRLVDKEFSDDQTSASGRIAAGYYACLTVRDSGEGMEPEVASRIFDPFFTTKPLGEGRGMGLSVVHGIVTAHGGTVLVESQPDLGTTVSVYLPALPPRTSSAVAPQEPLPHGHECILFVDDEESLAHFGGEMLESLGYYPVVRMNAADAWQAFKIAPQQFHLLITDLTMPGMSGETLAQECQRLRPDLPVILCTGSDQTLSAEKARAHGVTEYVLKPLLLHDLAHLIRRVLDGRPMDAGSSTEAQAFLSHDTTEEQEEHDAVSTRR